MMASRECQEGWIVAKTLKIDMMALRNKLIVDKFYIFPEYVLLSTKTVQFIFCWEG
ncbi:hypothetical protein LFYK43_05020 [Ligilactobacillus salitolerans]|uniref:Uncharacterized protein n=1 Tax=Ligilactobacillus salitolerans TaxID=1808352 RepID=A0A401IR82_9LACO|nr:hypothetical protein LFYK43_05020 [Ligilactobacillus salitolerans]